MRITSFKPLIYFLLFCIFFIFIFNQEKRPDELVGKKIKVIARISSIKQLPDGGFLYKIDDFYFKDEDKKPLGYGEKIEVVGILKEQVTSRGEKQLWLQNQAIIKILSDSKWEQWLFTSVSRKIQPRILVFFKKSLPEPQSSLFLGIVWGIKAGFRKELYQTMKQAGLVHLVVASGQNLSIFSKVLLDWLSLVLKRKLALVLSLLVILFYVLLIGAEPPLVRAALMASLSFLGMYLGREVLGGVALFSSALLMVLFDFSLLGSISFQLSFAATAGLVFVAPRLKKFRAFKWPILGQNFLESFSAQLMTSPIIFYHFGLFNPWSLISNLLVLWMIPILMTLGMAALFVNLIWPALGKFLLLLAWPLLTFFIRVAYLFGT